ncbi:MAG: hydrogenase formation protein HypD [Lewinellaceae bacterium]|nr:hydrogenase formation protein HypD [Lewinellaceae bacterium]MCB9296038.1 hydrogenase formation protein HypD [Lewinellaceae bacterium]
MKYLTEYRDPELVDKYLREIEKATTRPWALMEFCGGQTHSLVKNGLVNMLPDKIRLVHGPGCPVCVTPLGVIDQALQLAFKKGVILCSFGDMLRVPGTEKSLLQARAEGAGVRFFYSPMEAVQLAKDNPDKEVVFFAVGFETTAPANALSVLHAQQYGLNNYSLLTSHVLVPPAMRAILEDEDSHIDGFLGAGNVCSVMGLEEYEPIVEDYHIPIVVTGFEPVDLLQGILMLVAQLEKGVARLENQYSRVVPYEGNPAARAVIWQVFEPTHQEWRGIGIIPGSGLKMRPAFAGYDANVKFSLAPRAIPDSQECIAGEVLRGHKKPPDCPHFGKKCTPLNPLGAPMVSSEGACAAYYHLMGEV